MAIEVGMKSIILSVDEGWYYLDCSFKVGNWIDTQDRSQWKAIGTRTACRYLVHEKLMVLLLLRWPDEILEQK